MISFFEKKELEDRIGRIMTEEEYIGVFEDFIMSKDSLETFMREYPFNPVRRLSEA